MQREYVDEHGDEQVEEVSSCERCNAEVSGHDKGGGPAECEDCKEDFRELRETIIRQATEIAQLRMLVERICDDSRKLRFSVRHLEDSNDELMKGPFFDSAVVHWDFVVRQLGRVDGDLADKVRRYRP